MSNIIQEQIMQNWDNKNCNELMVSICCITYNHESYIEDALNGFIHQKTNFKYEIVISNDCSTDKTQQVIDKFKEKYPDLIRDISPSENLGSINNFYYALNSCNGKYIAYCEGDDYWIDENKLQMQVAFLEKNPDYGMCYTCAKEFFQDKKKFSKKNFGSYVASFEDLLVNGNRIPTLTVCARKELIMQYVDEIKPREKNWLMGDYPMWLYLSYKSKIHFFNKQTAVYRVLSESASHSKDVSKSVSFFKSYYEIRSFFANKYNARFDEKYNENEVYISFAFAKSCREALLKVNSNNIGTKYKIIKISAKTKFSFYMLFYIRKIYLLVLNMKQKILNKEKTSE